MRVRLRTLNRRRKKFTEFSILELTKNNEEIAELKKQNELLSSQLKESQTAQFKLQRDLDEKIAETNKILRYQSAVGAVLGELLWKTSQSEETINKCVDISNGETLRDFLYLSHLTFKSFITQYDVELPPESSPELKFVTALFGILVNISGHSTGRKFILGGPTGLALLSFTLEMLQRIALPSGHFLKKTMIIFLNNISIGTRGILFFQQEELALKSFFKCLHDVEVPEIQIFALHIITSLIQEVPSVEFNRIVTKVISVEELDKVIEISKDKEFIELAKELKQKLISI
jgi:hypothetical protein